jgi:hypothetical protein
VNRTKRVMLKVASGGGWLANALNQMWKHGPLIIAFGERWQRDEVFAWLEDQSETSGQYRDREAAT